VKKLKSTIGRIIDMRVDEDILKGMDHLYRGYPAGLAESVVLVTGDFRLRRRHEPTSIAGRGLDWNDRYFPSWEEVKGGNMDAPSS